MKKIALYPGCIMQTEQYAYELSLREILPKLDIDLVESGMKFALGKSEVQYIRYLNFRVPARACPKHRECD